METLTYKQNEDARREINNDVFTPVIKQINERRIEQALRFGYHMEDDDLRILQSFFPSRYVLQTTNTEWKTSSHPILASLNDFCNEEAANSVARDKRNGLTTMTIGDASRPKIRAQHNCLLIDSVRECYRVTNSQLANKDHAIRREFINKSVNNQRSLLCCNGTEKCNFQADVCYCVHSTYDINPELLPLIFERHGLVKMIIYMYLPLVLYGREYANIDELAHNIHIDDDRAIFSMKDGSIPYVHSVKRWKLWAEFTKINYGNHSLIRENIASYGPLTVINIVKTTQFKDNIYMNIPLHRAAGKYYLVPSIRHAAHKHFVGAQEQLKHYLVPKHVVDQAMSYTARQADEAYKFVELATVLSGQLRQIKIGSVVYADRWNCSPKEYNDVAISLFIIGAKSRTDRTTIISQAFKHLKEYGNGKNEITYELRNLFYSVVNKLQESYSHKEERTNSLWLYDYKEVPDSYKTKTLKVELESTDYKLPETESETESDQITTDNSDSESDEEVFKCASKYANNHLPKARRACPNITKAMEIIHEGTNDYSEEENEIVPGKPADNTILDEMYEALELPAASAINTTDNDKSHAPVPTATTSVINTTDDDKSVTTTSPANADSEQTPQPSPNTATDADDPADATTSTPVPTETTKSARSQSIISDTRSTKIIRRSEIVQSILSTATWKDRVLSTINLLTNAIANKDEQNIIKYSNYFKLYPHASYDEYSNATTLIGTKFLGDVAYIMDTEEIFKAINDSRNFNIQTIEIATDNTTRTVLPAKFIPGGHCMIRSFWSLLPKHKKPKVNEFIKQLYNYMLNHIEQGPDDLAYNKADLDKYFIKGIYDTNATDSIYARLCEMYKCCINVVNLDKDANNRTVCIGDTDCAEQYIVYYKGNHYSHLPSGGASPGVDKFNFILDTVIDIYGENIKTFADISCAPGIMSTIVLTDNRIKLKKSDLYNYAPGFKPSKLINDDGSKLIPNATYNVINYCKFEEIKEFKYDFVFYDAAREYNSESLLDDFVPHMKRLCSDARTIFAIKAFSNPIKLWEEATHYDVVYRVHPNSKENEEDYYILWSRHDEPISTFHSMYEKFHKKITTHAVPYDNKLTTKFVDYLYSGEFKSDTQRDKVARAVRGTSNHIYYIQALTGYASASKTTTAVELYSDAMFIAPTKHLSIKHNNMGVQSFTPHTALRNLQKYETIVIDEFTQFFLEYVSIVHAIHPTAKIIVMGDTYQIPAVDFSTRTTTKFNQIKSYGINNNIMDVYKIPQDICKIINDKMKTHIRSSSTITDSIRTYSGDLVQLIKTGVQFVCFNDKSKEHIIKKGGKCNTITTYQGDRENAIVFYIDDNSVTSQLINRTEWVYTALTRHKRQIVLYGNHNYIETYFHIRGTPLANLEELSQVMIVNDTYNKTMENNLTDSQISVIQEDEGTESIATAPSVAAHITAAAITPVNEATPATAFLQPVEMPAIESGSITIPIEAILHKHRTFKGYQYLPNVPLVKNQFSNDTKETVRTMSKRYSKRMPKLSDERNRINTAIMIKSLCRTLYGNNHSLQKLIADLKTSPEELRSHAADYLKSAQTKINNNPAFITELTSAFEYFDETITFVNKKQAKFDPEEGFDSKDKVGQGVASLSKRVNFVLCAYSRCLLHKIREIARNNNKNIIIATHDSDEAIATEYAANIGENYSNWFCADVSEWDSMFQTFMTKVTHELCSYLGMPQWLNDYFFEYRKKWTMVYHTKFGNVKLRGEGKQFSGNPFTIAENTICNLALVNTIFEFDRTTMQMYKGDDSAINCHGYALTDIGKTLLKVTKHNIKQHFGAVGDFAGFILTNKGMFPDVLRYSCKFLGKIYKDHEHFNEAKANTSATLKVVKSQSALEIGAIATAIYYEKNGLTPDNVKTLYNFLRNCGTIKFDSLTEVNKPIASQ